MGGLHDDSFHLEHDAPAQDKICNDPLNMVMMKHVSDDPTRQNLLYED